MSQSTMNKISDTIGKPVTTGLAAGVGSMVLFSEANGQRIEIGSFSIPAHVAVGLAGAASSSVGEVIKNWVLPYIKGNKNFAMLEGNLLNPILSGATMAVVTYPWQENGTGTLKMFTIGVGSNMAGSYVYDSLLQPLPGALKKIK